MGDFVDRFLTTNSDYSDLFDEETSNKLWEEFIDYMYKKGFFTGVTDDPSNGKIIDDKADLGMDLNGDYSDDLSYRVFIEKFKESEYWNDSVLKAAEQFYNEFLDPDTKATINEYLADAGNSFTKGEEYVKDWTNADNQNYSDVRGSDQIESVLTNEQNLLFTRKKLTDEELSEIDKIKTLLRLIMPKYSRRVEIEDLNRNFWVIGQTLDFVLDYLLGKQSPMIELLGKLIKESAEAWLNIYFLWATTAALEGKINDVLTDIKKIEAGTEKTPLNIYLHFPTSDNNTTDETWLRLFKLYDRKDEIESFEVTDAVLFGQENVTEVLRLCSKYLNSNALDVDVAHLNDILEIMQNWGTPFEGDNFYPGYNGYNLIGPHTQDFYDNIDVAALTRPTLCKYGEKGLSYPRLGGMALATVKFKKQSNEFCTMCYYDMGHPFSSTEAVNQEIGDTEITNGQYLKKVKKVNNSFWDIFNYANYDKVSGCIDIVLNRILYDNIEWERKEEYGKVSVYSSNEQKLDHTVNDFANLHYSRTKANADKRDMAQIIQDVASFNYVYRFKNSSTDLTKSTIADYIPYKRGKQTSYLNMFYDFLSSLLVDVATNSAENRYKDKSLIIRPGYVKFVEYFYADYQTIKKLPNRILGLENFNELFNLPTLKNLKNSYKKLISAVNDSDEKTEVLCNFIKQFLLEIFGFDYDKYINYMIKPNPLLINMYGELSYSEELNSSLIANISCEMSKIFLKLEDLNISDELSKKFNKCSSLISDDKKLNAVTDEKMETDSDISISKQDLKEMFNCYISRYIIQSNQRDLSSYSINPFLTLSMPWNFSQTYSINQYAREALQAVQNNNENFLVEIIATGTDAAATTFINDKYNSLTTPIEMYYSDEKDNKKPKFPAVNRYMQYERLNGNINPRINMLVTSIHDMESKIRRDDVNANLMFDTLAASGILQGFGIIAEEDYPDIKNDYLAAYIQPNFSNVAGYEFRFIDNPATSYGKFKINIINYSARYFLPRGITGAGYPTICFNCHNSSLNIPFDLSNTKADQNRLTDIFSVGMPMPVGKTFTMEELKERNVHQIRYEGGYFYKYINTSESRPTSLDSEMKLGISDGCFGVKGAVSDLLLLPTVTNIDLDRDTTSYDIFKQKKNFENYVNGKETDEHTWHDYIEKAYQENFFSQKYIDNKETSHDGQNFINPVFAYSGDDGGINGLRDMYISTSIPALPYYRLDSASKYGDTYGGYNSHGGKEKPSENFHEEIAPLTIYNLEYSAYNDIYIRDIVPLNYTKPKVYVDISVFSDLNTIFKVEFLKDEYKVKFPGLSKKEVIPIDNSFGNGSFNFIKIGNYSNKTNACLLADLELTNDKIIEGNFEYVKAGVNKYQGTNYIYNFRYLYDTTDTDEISCWCELFNIDNSDTLTITEYKVRDNDNTEGRLQLKKSDVINAGKNVISHFITKNLDYWYSKNDNFSDEKRKNTINYFITGIGRQPEHLINKHSQLAYWLSSTLCHAFVTIPSKIVLNEYDNIKLNVNYEELKEKFGEENITEINEDSKTIYLILLGPINLTDGYFEFLVGDEGKLTLEKVDKPAGYYVPTGLDRWRGPFVKIREDSNLYVKITAEIEKITSNTGIKYKANNVLTEIPDSIDITCGMLDYRTAQTETNLSEDKYTVIKGNFKLNLKSDEIFTFDNGLAFCSRANGPNSNSINNEIYEREDDATLNSCFDFSKLPDSPLKNVLVKDAIFTNSRTLPYSE